MNWKKIKRICQLCLLGSLCISMIAGCGKQENKEIKIVVGNWPAETDKVGLSNLQMAVEVMAELRPDVKVIPDTTAYTEPKTFQLKATANQLPTLWRVHLTEINKTIKSGYAAEITKIMKERGFTDAMNEKLLELATRDGKIYAVPNSAYLMGLNINKELFRQAGLVHEDGSVMIPDTYAEMARYAQLIKEKTGKAGFAICTTDGCGGWLFMSLAWSYGVTFMEQNPDGSWKATFNTQEAIDALAYLKALRWEYQALPETTAIDYPELHKLFGTGQAAMIFEAPSNDYTTKYGFEPENLVMAKMPKGPKGRFAQTGGEMYMFSPDATEQELNAAFDWLEVRGMKRELDAEAIENYEKECRENLTRNTIIWPREPVPVWTTPERESKLYEIRERYTQVNIEDYASYYDVSDVEIRAEEPVCCQQLYTILDGCIQEIMTDKNADCKKLIEEACQDFQVHYLNKE